MRELSEQEKEAMYEVYSKSDLPHLSGGIVTFQAGFIAGLEYAQTKIDELEAKIKELIEFVNWDVSHS